VTAQSTLCHARRAKAATSGHWDLAESGTHRLLLLKGEELVGVQLSCGGTIT
jgi:hypothetical protein